MNYIIHQTWKNGNLDEEQSLWVNSIKKAFPNYEYKFWTDEDNLQFIRLKHPEFLKFYEELNAVEKTDFIRHLYIYNFGGIYLDIDVKMNKPLVLEGADVFLCDQTKEANTEKLEVLVDPFFLAGEERCLFFYSVCESMVRGTIYNILSSKTGKKYHETLYKTGPYMFTKFYLINRHKYNIKVLKDVFTTKYYETDVPKEQFYGIHMQFNSWLKPEDRRR